MTIRYCAADKCAPASTCIVSSISAEQPSNLHDYINTIAAYELGVTLTWWRPAGLLVVVWCAWEYQLMRLVYPPAAALYKIGIGIGIGGRWPNNFTSLSTPLLEVGYCPVDDFCARCNISFPQYSVTTGIVILKAACALGSSGCVSLFSRNSAAQV
jgi:hypothetical protein